MSSWDERCPHCRTHIAIYDHFVANDYEREFTIDCPLCQKEICVVVHMVPEFELEKG